MSDTAPLNEASVKIRRRPRYSDPADAIATANAAMLPGTAEKDDASNKHTVGYGKPPQASRFRKGQSGNPKGRPPGAKGLTTLARKVLDAKLLVRTARGEEYLPRIEIGLLKLVEKGNKGDIRAITQMINLYRIIYPEFTPGETMPAPASLDAMSAADEATLEALKAILAEEQAAASHKPNEE